MSNWFAPDGNRPDLEPPIYYALRLAAIVLTVWALAYCTAQVGMS